MSAVIYSYAACPLQFGRVSTVQIPPGSRIISAAVEHDDVVLYALWDRYETAQQQPDEYRRVLIVHTGQVFDCPEDMAFIDTVQLGSNALHIFADNPAKGDA